MMWQKQPGRRNYTPHGFSRKIYCDECGALSGSKTWHKQTVWTCNARSKGEAHCKTPALRNATIEAAFIRTISQTIAQKDEIIRICVDTMRERCDTSGINSELEKLHIVLEVMTEMMQRQISVNAQMALDQAEYKRQFGEYEASYNETKARISTLENEHGARMFKRGAVSQYVETLRTEGRVAAFNERLWYGTVEQVRVLIDGKIRFVFKDGLAAEIG